MSLFLNNRSLIYMNISLYTVLFLLCIWSALFFLLKWEEVGSASKTIPKSLGPAYMTDLDFLDCFEKEKMYWFTHFSQIHMEV